MYTLLAFVMLKVFEDASRGRHVLAFDAVPLLRGNVLAVDESAVLGQHVLEVSD